jgi:hypothetical protein
MEAKAPKKKKKKKCDGRSSYVTVVAQWAKAPGIHCYEAGSAVTHRYCTNKIEKKKTIGKC